MTFKSKILAAAIAAVALAGTAHAASPNPPSSGNGDLVLYAWDTNPNATVPNQSYAIDTGISLSSILTFTGSETFNLTGSSVFQGLFGSGVGSDAASGFVDFTLLAGNDKTANPILVSGASSTPVWVPGQTQVGSVDAWADTAAGNLISSTNEYSLTASIPGNGVTLGTNLLGFTGANDDSVAGGTALSLYESVSVPNGGTPKAPILNPAAVTALGITAQLFADGELIISAPAATPLPAAAWLLGSGLLGLFGIGRRRAA
jgi:hypothetical protein